MLLKSWNLYDIVLYKNVETKQIWMSKEFDTNICNPCVPNRYRRKISPAFVFYNWRWGYVWRIYQRMLSDKTLQMHKTWLLFYFILTRAFEIIYLDFENIYRKKYLFYYCVITFTCNETQTLLFYFTRYTLRPIELTERLHNVFHIFMIWMIHVITPREKSLWHMP